MRIQDIKIGKINAPLRNKYKLGNRVITSSEEIVIKIITENGEEGVGSAAPTGMITGDIESSIIGAIQYVKPDILGMEIDNIEGIMRKIDNSLEHNSSAKAAIDIAVYDLFAKRCNIPLYKLLGGYKNSIVTDLTINEDEIETMVRNSLDAIMKGYTTLKIKVGSDPQEDIERVKAVRKAVPKGIKIRVDGNQGWRPKEAVRIIHKFQEMGLDIEFVEQPVKAWDLEGLKYVTDNVETPILADEAVFSPQDAFKIIRNRAADLINIKLMKCGGIHNAIKICNMAETMGMKCMMGCMVESKIGITAAASFAVAKRSMIKADLDTMILFSEDSIIGGATFYKNEITMTDAPGLGIADVIGWQEIGK